LEARVLEFGIAGEFSKKIKKEFRKEVKESKKIAELNKLEQG